MGPHRNAGCAELLVLSANFEPRLILESADCYTDGFSLAFDIDSDGGRENSLHKLESLVFGAASLPRGARRRFEPATTAAAPAPRRLASDPKPGYPAGQHLRPAGLTPWLSGEARACKARQGGSTPPGVFQTWWPTSALRPR